MLLEIPTTNKYGYNKSLYILVNRNLFFRKYFFLSNKMNKTVMDVRGSNRRANAEVIMYKLHHGDNQQWYQDDEGIIRSKMNDFALDSSSRLSHNINISLIFTTLI